MYDAAAAAGIPVTATTVGACGVTFAGGVGVGYCISYYPSKICGKLAWDVHIWWINKPPKDKTLDHWLDLGDSDYDDRADWCAGFADRRARARCYQHCNVNKNEWNN